MKPTQAEPTPPKVTAIVLNWCGESVSRECLQSLRESDYPSLTILLVDNGSHDQSGERLREAFPDVDYVQTGSNLGYTGGNNRGIQWALERDADFILILNNDTVVEPNTVSQLVDAARGGGNRVGGVVPKILFYGDPNRIWFGGGEFDRLKGLGVHWREGDSDDSGGVEEQSEVTFMTGAGYNILYQPQARVLHHAPPPGTPPTSFQIRQRDRNRRRVMRTHFPLGKRLPFLFRFYLTRVILLLRYLLSGDGDRTRAILAGMGKI